MQLADPVMIAPNKKESVLGVHVGDHFYFRMELCVIGFHGPTHDGIDYMTSRNSEWNEPVAISIITSRGYKYEDDSKVLVCNGQEGNNWILCKKQSVTVDQNFERDNLTFE